MTPLGHIEGERFVFDERVCLTEDDRPVVEGHPDGRWLYAIPGHDMTLTAATELGLTEGQSAEVPDGVPTGSAGDVIAWVAGDRDRAQAALEAESHSAKPRKALTTTLAALVATGTDAEEE